MTFAPKSLLDLATYWQQQGGINLGIVGDTGHALKGVSYHLGRDQLKHGAYSAETARDKAGLSNAASAIDLGRLGDLKHLQRFSDWLARRCVKNEPGTGDVREVIYSPDGSTVLGFKDGVDFLIPDYGDRTHLSHTHISFYRDSEKRDKTALFKPYFELPESDTEDQVTLQAGDDFTFGWEQYNLDSSGTVYCLGGPRLPTGDTDSAFRLCAAGPTSQILTVVARDRLTNGKPVAGSDALWASITSGKAADSKAAVNAALDQVVGPADAVLLAIRKARP